MKLKKGVKSKLITYGIIILIILASILIINSKKHPGTSEEITKCIGENSILYTQLGCSHCETQEEIFRENIQYLNIIDCFFEKEKCSEITATPTWKIKNEFYKGVKSVEELQELTGC